MAGGGLVLHSVLTKIQGYLAHRASYAGGECHNLCRAGKIKLAWF